MSVKIIVLSDSHGKREYVRRICEMHRDADYIFHAGDGVFDLVVAHGMKAKRVCVCGNCDCFAGDIADEEKTVIEGITFFLMHGYNYGVKMSLERLESKARNVHADVVIFGHTHNPIEKCIPCDDGKYLYLFNPGSVREGSFGLISIKNGSILFSHGNVKNV